MKIYVVSFFGNGESTKNDGVYCAFDSLERAMVGVGRLCEIFDESILDYDNNLITWHFYTTKGTYIIEEMTLNQEGF